MFDWRANLKNDLEDWTGTLPELLALADSALSPGRHGDLPRWLRALESLPPAAPGWQVENGIVVADANHPHSPQREVSPPLLQKGGQGGCERSEFLKPGGSEPHQAPLKEFLMHLQPWRKGPFRLADISIDTEWRSDCKWDRIKTHIDLKDQTILDIGAGNGYFGWRMLDASARRVIACDPTLVFVMQHLAVCHFAGPAPNHLLPLRLEELPEDLNGFDTIFSMGVLYHRRDHLAHLKDLKKRLKPGGRVVLETLILPGEDNTVLHPPDRYANMRNVHAIPTLPILFEWLAQAGFDDARCVDQTWTTTDEQRRTEWMPFHSLKQALSEDGRTTIESHPPPLRAMVIADTKVPAQE